MYVGDYSTCIEQNILLQGRNCYTAIPDGDKLETKRK